MNTKAEAAELFPPEEKPALLEPEYDFVIDRNDIQMFIDVLEEVYQERMNHGGTE